MKILKKISIFILIIMTLFATNITAKANETTKYFAQRSDYGKTTRNLNTFEKINLSKPLKNGYFFVKF